MRAERLMLVGSIISRLGVAALLCALALMSSYVNLKQAYNNPRLVELSLGATARKAYEVADAAFGQLGDPMEVAQSNGGMTWSIRILGMQFTDPVAALSVLSVEGQWELGFALGLFVPLLLVFVFGRVFCSYICPASILFFAVARVRRLLGRWFYFPEWHPSRGLAWGILFGGLGVAMITGHGVWLLLLPYFALGQTIFHGLAMGTLSVASGSLIVFVMLDFFLGRQFTCRHVCPTGRVLGWLGQRPVFTLQRDASRCIDGCNSCAEICPQGISPRLDQTVDCSLCGECMMVCPTHCLTVRRRRRLSPRLAKAALLFWLLSAGPLFAHHFKGLPHYNYFENYPQVPEEEFLGQAGEYETSLVVYDFQGIHSPNIEDPENVRLFLVIFNLRNSRVYQGELTFEILDGGRVLHSKHYEKAQLENMYSAQRNLSDTGDYAVRLTLHDDDERQCVIPFRLSSQKTHWGRWIALGLMVMMAVTAVGARKARLVQDRCEAHKRNLSSTAYTR